MKKFSRLVLLAGLVVSGFTGNAKAAEFKPFAEFVEEFYYGDEGSRGVDSKENFGVYSRIRFGFDYVASEDLSATMLFQYGEREWGNNGNDFTADPSTNDNLFMRLAYIDWTLPTTEVKVRMGRHPVVTPSYAFGSPILDDRFDGITLASNVNDNILVTGSWLRLISGEGGHRKGDDADAFLLTSEFAYDGFKVAPWAMYFNIEHGAAPQFGNTEAIINNTKAYALGISAELTMFDPFTFAVDTMYNKIDSGKKPAGEVDSYDSYYVGASASYALNNGAVALKGWWATGTDVNKNDKAYIPFGGGFGATSMYFDDNEIAADGFNMGNSSPMGTMGLIAEYADFSFMDKLTHTARVAYIKGTNEAKLVNGVREAGQDIFSQLTDEDNLVELNFNSTYEIYKNLSATLELGYMFVDMNKLSQADKANGVDNDIFRSTLRFVYSF